jgi:hypothetical protein
MRLLRKTAAASDHLRQAKIVARLLEAVICRDPSRSVGPARLHPFRTTVTSARSIRPREPRHLADNPAAVADTGIGRHPVPPRRNAITPMGSAADPHGHNLICVNPLCGVHLTVAADIRGADTVRPAMAARAALPVIRGPAMEVADRTRRQASAEAVGARPAVVATSEEVEVEVAAVVRAAEVVATPAADMADTARLQVDVNEVNDRGEKGVPTGTPFLLEDVSLRGFGISSALTLNLETSKPVPLWPCIRRTIRLRPVIIAAIFVLVRNS